MFPPWLNRRSGAHPLWPILADRYRSTEEDVPSLHALELAATEQPEPLEGMAWDGYSYSEKDFRTWYGPGYRTTWDLALPSGQEPQRNANPIAQQPSETPGASSHDAPRDASEHSLQAPTLNAAPSSASDLTLECPACNRTLCHTSELAFFERINKQNGVEVHLMLKPENNVPETFRPAAEIEPGALHSWSCACGAKLGDTRPVAVGKAPMTAFKSASVILCGQHFAGKKSKWPTVYTRPPFNHIEVRHRNTYFG